MPLVQNTFTLVPNAVNFSARARQAADSDDGSPAPVSKPPMTSKQAQKLYKAEQAKKHPKLSKAEQRRQEKEQQERIRKELDRERTAAKARAARDKKKLKEDAVREDKKRRGQPLVDVRPSQDTIARFVRGPAVSKKRGVDAAGLEACATIQEEDEESQNKENAQPISLESMVPGLGSTTPERLTPAAKRQRLSPPLAPPVPFPEAEQSHVAPEVPSVATVNNLSEVLRPTESAAFTASVAPPIVAPGTITPAQAAGPTSKGPSARGTAAGAHLAAIRNSEVARAPEPVPQLRRSARPKPRTSTMPSHTAASRNTLSETAANPPRFAHPGLHTSEKKLQTPYISPQRPLQKTSANVSRSPHSGLRPAVMRPQTPSVSSRKPLQATSTNASRSPHPGLHLAEKSRTPFVPTPVQDSLAYPPRFTHPGLQFAEKNTRSSSAVSAASPQIGPMGPPARPPQFKTPQTGGRSSPLPRFLPGHLNTPRSRTSFKPLQASASRAAPATENLPPTSTQLFVMNNLDELFPTASQEARELLEDGPVLGRTTEPRSLRKPAPKATHTAAPVKTPPMVLPSATNVRSKMAPPPTAAAQDTRGIHHRNNTTIATGEALSSRVPRPLIKRPSPPKPQADPFPFLSTQDLIMSSQDMRELDEPCSSVLSRSSCGSRDCPQAVSQPSLPALSVSQKVGQSSSNKRERAPLTRSRSKKWSQENEVMTALPQARSKVQPISQKTASPAPSHSPSQKRFFHSSGDGADYLAALERSRREEALRQHHIARQRREEANATSKPVANPSLESETKASKEEGKPSSEKKEWVVETEGTGSQETDYGDIDMTDVVDLEFDVPRGQDTDSMSDYGDLDDDLDLLAAIKC